MSKIEEYVKAVESYEAACADVRGLQSLISTVGRALEGSSRYKTATDQNSTSSKLNLLYLDRGAAKKWPTEEEIVLALLRVRDTAAHAQSIWEQIPEQSRNALKPINPRSNY